MDSEWHYAPMYPSNDEDRIRELALSLYATGKHGSRIESRAAAEAKINRQRERAKIPIEERDKALTELFKIDVT